MLRGSGRAYASGPLAFRFPGRVHRPFVVVESPRAYAIATAQVEALE
jgi:hypothetical protein